MDDERRYQLLFQELLHRTYDGMIVIDTEGRVTDISDQYCTFLKKNKEDVLGKKIEDVISSTSMYSVLKEKKNDEGVVVRPYLEKETTDEEATFALANRFCIFDDDGDVMGAMAQVQFKKNLFIFRDYLYREEFKHFREGLNENELDSKGFRTVLGEDTRFLNLVKQGKRAAKTDFPVLLTGETGTGKEVFARAIHMESNRRSEPMVSINCAAIPSELVESELFGYEEGAFTGAKRGGKIGKFQIADGGTLFLDEIGDLPLALQGKLLRVLQEKEIEKVGGYKPIPVNVRVIAATRRDLTRMMENNEFREDLFYRLSVINLEMIPLRERPGDIPLFANYFLAQLNKEYKTEVVFCDATKQHLRSYNWPGNIRELSNVVSSAYASREGSIIELSNLPSKIISHRLDLREINNEGQSLKEILSDYESTVIRSMLKKHGQRVGVTATALGIDRSVLYKKMQKYGISIRKTLD